MSTKAVNFRFNADELARWDSYGKEENLTRTALVKKALNSLIDNSSISTDTTANDYEGHAMDELLKRDNQKLEKEIQSLRTKLANSPIEKAKEALVSSRNLSKKLEVIGDVSKHPMLTFIRKNGLKIKNVDGSGVKINNLTGLLDYLKNYIEE